MGNVVRTLGVDLGSKFILTIWVAFYALIKCPFFPKGYRGRCVFVLVKLLYLKIVTTCEFWVSCKALVKTDKALTVMYLDNFKGLVIEELALFISLHGYPIDPGCG